MDDPTELYYQFAWIPEANADVEGMLASAAVDLDNIIKALKDFKTIKYAIRKPAIDALNQIKTTFEDFILETQTMSFEGALKQIKSMFQSAKTTLHDNNIPMITAETIDATDFMKLIIRRCTLFIKLKKTYRVTHSKDNAFARTERAQGLNLPTNKTDEKITTVYNGQQYFTMNVISNYVAFTSNMNRFDDTVTTVFYNDDRKLFVENFIDAFNAHLSLINKHHTPIQFTATHSALHWHALDRLATLVDQFHASIY